MMSDLSNPGAKPAIQASSPSSPKWEVVASVKAAEPVITLPFQVSRAYFPESRHRASGPTSRGLVLGGPAGAGEGMKLSRS
jgi:hypothetical protein